MKRIHIFLLFSLSLLSTLTLLHLVNSHIPALSSGSALAEDITKQTYAITEYDIDDSQTDVTILFTDVDSSHRLALSMSDMGAYTLYVNDVEVYSYQEDSIYSRSHYIAIPTNLLRDDGILKLNFKSPGWGKRSAEILTGKLNAPPKILIGSLKNAIHAYQAANNLLKLLNGMCYLLIFISMLLFLCRPSETGFLFLSLVTLMRLITMSINTPDSLFSISMQNYYRIRPMLVTFPVVFHAAMGIYLLRESLTDNQRKYFNIYTITILTLSFVVLQKLSSRNWYHLFQLFCFGTFFAVAWRACRQRIREAALLLVCYGIAAAIILYVYLINVWQIAPAGLIMTSISITHFSYMSSLLACTAAINIRLMDRFHMTELLSNELASANALLDQRVEERTRELQESQRQKQNILLNIFHDLRNPVFVLKGCVRKLSPVNEEQRHYRQLIDTRLDQLEQLIEDLFLIEKLESGKLLMNEEHVSMKQLIQTVSDSSKLAVSSPDQIRMTLPSDDCYVWGDSLRLLQAFQNLAENALTHITANGWLHLTLASTEQAAICTVSDNGSGIAPEDLPYIFDRYYSSSKRPKSSSTGLGLSIARELILAHGGSISVNSTPGNGSTFTIVLPRTLSPANLDSIEEDFR